MGTLTSLLLSDFQIVSKRLRVPLCPCAHDLNGWLASCCGDSPSESAHLGLTLREAEHHASSALDALQGAAPGWLERLFQAELKPSVPPGKLSEAPKPAWTPRMQAIQQDGAERPVQCTLAFGSPEFRVLVTSWGIPQCESWRPLGIPISCILSQENVEVGIWQFNTKFKPLLRWKRNSKTKMILLVIFF